jgi:hypothetical protein
MMEDNSNIGEWFFNLDVCVMRSLDFLSAQTLPRPNFSLFRRPLVTGSGNAVESGRILFQGQDAVLSDESSYTSEIQKPVDGAFLISASGKKDAPAIGKAIKERGIKGVLLTCNPNAPAGEYFDSKNVFVYPKIPEPYTYNTSTYMGMIVSKTGESPGKIREHLVSRVAPALPGDFSEFRGYYFLVPKQFHNIKAMLRIKFEELFGRRLGRDFYTPEFATNHATDIVTIDDELAVSIGYDNQSFGARRLNIPLSEDADYGEAMAAAYYVIGKIQASNPPHFKNSLVEWCERRGINPLAK